MSVMKVQGFTNNMSEITRGLLSSSIAAFKAATQKDKVKMIKHVANQLENHSIGVNNIGFGYAEDYVKAGKIFLRLVTLYKLA